MKTEIYTVYHMSIAPADYEAFKSLIEEIVAATSKETDALIYEFVVNADRTAVHVFECYRAPGLLLHIEQTFAPFAERFLKLAKIEKAMIYGETTPEMRATLDGFGAEYFTPMAGFSRS